MARGIGGRRSPQRWQYLAGVVGLFALSLCLILAGGALAAALITGWKPVVVDSGSMSPALRRGDVALFEPAEGAYGPGTVLLFDGRAGGATTVHRVVGIDPAGRYVTKGDANGRTDSTPVEPASVLGAGRLLVPFVGLPIASAHAGDWAAVAAWGAALALVAYATPWAFHPPGDGSSLGRGLERWNRAVARATTTSSMAAVLLVVLVGSPVVTGRAVAAFTGVTQSSGNSLSAAADFTPAVYLYAHNNPTPPTSNTNSQTTLPMNAAAPTATTLYNYDTNRDASAGLLLAKTANPPQSETDPVKRQIWTYAVAQDLPAGSSVSLTMWAAIKDFGAGKRGVLEAAVLSCTSSGTGCVVVASGSVSADPWHPAGTATWVSKTFSLGTLTSTVAAGRQLRLVVVIDDLSGDDMWLAYDTTARASVLVVG